MFLQTKKGVSEMVGYVLLIVIAVGISIMVYNFLYVFIPKEHVQCEEGVSFIITNASCTSEIGSSTERAVISVKFLNKGRFDVHYVYVRAGVPESKVKKQINNK